MKDNEVAVKNPLVLAFIGDAYWTLYIRKRLVESSNEKVNKLHLSTNKFVCASAQNEFYNRIVPFLTETEQAIAGRARNAEVNTKAKNCTLAEYKHATAFEAVIGYNFLINNKQRLCELFDIILEQTKI